MNSQRKRAWSALAGLATVSLLATGCTSPGGGDSGEDKVITIWHTESTPRTMEAMEEIIDVFEAENPGYRVVQENVAWGDLQVKLQAALAAGELPELTHVEPMFVRTLFEQGLLQDLDGVVEELEDDYFPEIREMFELEDGHHYGITHAWGVDLTTYRVDLYDEAGQDPNQVSTFDEFADQLRALKETNPDVAPLSLAGSVAHNVQEEIQMWLGSNGGDLFDENGAPTLDTPEMKEVLEYWKMLADEGLIDNGWTSAAYADSLSNLALGNAATIFSFGRATYTFEEQNPAITEEGLVNVVADKPVGPSGDDWITQLDAEPWVSFKDSRNADMAEEFLKTFYEKENYLKWVGSVPTQLLPIMPSMFDDPDFLALPEVENWGFWIEAQRDVLATGKAYPLMITNKNMLELPYVSDLYGSGIILDLVMQVVVQGADVDSAMADAQRRAEELLTGRY